MKSMNRAVGAKGEEDAARALKKRGYRILEANFRAPRGEIDLVAEYKGMLVFIEVKARRDDRFGTPLDAVDARKRRRIIHAAEAYLATRKITDRAVRFDVVSVYLDRDPVAVEVLENAFPADPP